MISDDEVFCSGDEACSDDDQQPLGAHKVFSRHPVSAQLAESFEQSISSFSVAATMSAATHHAISPTSAASQQLSTKREVVSNSPQCQQKASTLPLGRAQVHLVGGTCSLALWSFLIVFWVCNSMPEQSDAVRSETRPFVMLLFIGVLLLIVLLAYGLVWPHNKPSIKSNKSSAKFKMRLVKAINGSALVTPEVQPVKQSLSPMGANSPGSASDGDNDGFVSCDEFSDCGDIALPGTRSIVGFLVEKKKLPGDAENRDYAALVMEIHRRCSLVGDLSLDQALRLSLGLDFDATAIVQKWREVCAWRDECGMAKEQARCMKLQLASSTDAVSFPHQDEIYNKAFIVRPCALVSRAGEPVSLWLAGTGLASASSVPLDRVEAWSRSVFEYTHTWAQTQSQATGQLLGQVQVFDMSGVGFRQITNSALHERFKCALGCGANYVELVSHIYVINSSWAFSKVWNIVKPMISKRTSSKVTVASDVPLELIDILTSDSSKMLVQILTASGRTVTSKVQRPPGQRTDSV